MFFFMQKTLSVLVIIILFCSCSLKGEVIHNNIEYGPCVSYLNVLGYKYSYLDLYKDTLKLTGQGTKVDLILLQKEGLLMEVLWYDSTSSKALSSTVVNGDGVIRFGNSEHYREFSFRNGMIDGPAINSTPWGDKVDSSYFHENYLQYQKDYGSFNTYAEAFFGEKGVKKEEKVFGFVRIKYFPWPRLWDSYKGSIYSRYLYNNGSLSKIIWYEKDGSVKAEEPYKGLKPRKARIHSKCVQ